MRNRFLLLFSIELSLMILGSGCSDIVPVWSGETVLKEQTLRYTEDPVEFVVDIDVADSIVSLRLELQITYYQGIGREDLPLFLILEDAQHNIIEHTTDIQLKSENEWLGVQEKNEIDYTLLHNAIPDISLRPGKYSLKIYANDQKNEQIFGIVKIVARFYRYEDGPSDTEDF